MRHSDDYADVEIRILKKDEDKYWVELTCNDEQEYPRGELAPVVLPHTLDPGEIGEALFKQLFADDHLKRGWATIRGQHPLRRIRLRIDADIPELHTIPWELLRDATSPDFAP